ncbi:type II toxin-antitoxin system HigB family toxin [Isosphaeraceae bacterium EP7]
MGQGQQHIISRKLLREFADLHPEDPSLPEALDEWFKKVRNARWRTFSDIRTSYAHADLVGGLVVFNLGGNKYRIVARVFYTTGKVYIRAVMTHREYDRGRWMEL